MVAHGLRILVLGCPLVAGGTFLLKTIVEAVI